MKRGYVASGAVRVRTAPGHAATARISSTRGSRFSSPATSPIDYFAGDYFFVHVIEHILIMFLVPALIVAGAPWTPFIHALPVPVRRQVVRALVRSPWFSPLRALRVFGRPLVAILAFNVVMVASQIPAAFDAAETNPALHIWGMHTSMLVVGVAFWLQIIDSPPFPKRGSPGLQIGAIVGTNVVMFVLAMAMSIFTTRSWYAPYDHVSGVTLPPFADQQIGAAILWVCGDFWAVPALIYVIRRAVETEGSLSDAVDRIFHRDPHRGVPGLVERQGT